LENLSKFQTQYWSTRAKEVSEARKVSIADPIQKDLEIKFIDSANIEFGNLLEVGCGNGVMTRYFESIASSVTALDISQEMIDRAISEGPFQENTKFYLGDATRLDFSDCTFDTVVMVRVLINMASRESQSQSIDEAHRVLKANGRLILIEGSSESFDFINSSRQSIGKNKIFRSPVNLYLNQDFFSQVVNLKFRNILEINSGVYDFLTRVLFSAQSDEETVSMKLGTLKEDLNQLLNFRNDADYLNNFSRLKGGVYSKLTL
jgi:ubiquinone/menaquinone biosynthesis C-methylase UbiE